MPARLYCKTGALAGAAFTIDREARIGRLRDNEITLAPKIISTRHARIFFDDGADCYVLEDLGSSNGTMLDGLPVTGPTRLEHLHIITLAGQHDFIFQTTPDAGATLPDSRVPVGWTNREQDDQTQVALSFESAPALAEAAETSERTTFEDAFDPVPLLPNQPEEKTRLQDPATPLPDAAAEIAEDDEPGPAPEPTAQPTAFILEVTLPDETHVDFPLKEGVNLVGRESTCAITLADPSISRNHASLTVRAGTVLLKDLHSKNATFVDGKKLTGEVELHPDAAISFGFGHEARLKQAEQ